MAYYDFPHTRNYDTDLGYLISQFKDLENKYGDVVDTYKKIKDEIAVIITQMLNDGVIFLNAKYTEADEKITFIFDSSGLDTHTYSSEDESINVHLSYLEQKGLLPTKE